MEGIILSNVSVLYKIHIVYKWWRVNKLPPTVMLVCKINSLCDEGIDYAMRLAHNGVEVTVRKFMNARHGFTVHSEEEGKYGQ